MAPGGNTTINKNDTRFFLTTAPPPLVHLRGDVWIDRCELTVTFSYFPSSPRAGEVSPGPSASVSALAGEEVPQGVVVVLVEGRVYERVEEGVGVAQPQEDALPDGRDVARAQRHDELGDEEGNPAEDEDADQDAHHQRRLLLLLLAPRVAVRLEGDGGVAHGEHHLRPRLLLHLVFTDDGGKGKKMKITCLGSRTDSED